MLAILVLGGYAASCLVLLVPRSAARTLGPATCVLALAIAWGAAEAYDSGNRSVSIEWVQVLGLELSFRIDGLSRYFALIVTLIGAGVFFYAGGYTRHWKQGAPRLFSQLLFFMASMLGLVLADNLLLLYVFWELTTVASFLLIGFKSEEPAARKAALVALIVTGAGGLSLLAGFLVLGFHADTFSLSELARQGTVQDPFVASLAAVLIGAGCLIKCGQFPFHFWLPRAMEAPTPASAYLHAATMVKAGLYLLARLVPVLGEAGTWTPLLAWAAVLSGVVALWGMLGETDMKACLAYSTIGALAVGVACLAVGSKEAMEVFAVFLLAHAAYKACLFMVAGALEESTGTRDLKRLSGMAIRLPGLMIAAIGGALALAEVGPQLSYIAKESALRIFHEAGRVWGALAFSALASGFVALSWIVGYSVFFSGKRSGEAPSDPVPSSLWIPALIFGWAGVPLACLPEFTSQWLVAPLVATTQVAAQAEVHLSLWHGWNWKVAATAATLIVGALGGCLYGNLQKAISRGNSWILAGSGRFLESASGFWLRASRRQRNWIEHGRLPLYIFAAVFAAAVATLPWIWESVWELGRRESLTGDDWAMDAFLVALSTTGIVATVLTARRSGLIVGLAVLGFALTIVYVRLGALDVALTHLLIETLMVALLAGALRGLPEIKQLSSRWMVCAKLGASLACGLAVALALLAGLRQGSGSRVSEFYLRTVGEEAGRSNVVAAIISDFRALDTMGEITVLATAGVGVYHLARSAVRKKDKG